MQRVRRFVAAAAYVKTSILIRGEVGTGKNPIASAIHNQSLRREGPFMIFACSSVPSELVVSELSGVEKGASSSIPGGRPSKFELANHGTLYFQDVDALPLQAQGMLLNLIDLGIIQRLGSQRPIPVDVRIIASTSADIEKQISQGNFRSDLFYRLSAFEITTPPLRNRLEDLPVLVDHIIRRLSGQFDHQIEVDPGVIEVLRNYPWPGNIRELEAVLGRAAMQAGFSGVIAPKNLLRNGAIAGRGSYDRLA
jgi:transcriptional regulator with PAS, ATPase and Fis domain